ncbi:MAG: prenyltransferase [Bdellovibrionia bacterium]
MSSEILSLPQDSAQALRYLNEGRIEEDGQCWAVLPRERVLGQNGVEQVLFERVRLELLSPPGRLQCMWRAIRPLSLTLTLGPILVTLAYGLAHRWPIASAGVGFLAALGAIFFQIAIHLFNDVEDYLRLIDLENSEGGSRVIRLGWVSARSLRQWAYGALILGGLCGLPALVARPQFLVGIGVGGLLGVLGYSNRPWGLKYRLLGDAVVFFLSGPLLTWGVSQALFAQSSPAVILLGIYFGLLSWAVLHSGNFQDIDLDSVRNFKTLANQLGFSRSRHVFPLIYGLATGLLILGAFMGWIPWILNTQFLVVPGILYRFLARIYEASGPASALLAGVRSHSLRIHLGLSALMLVSLILTYAVLK